MSRRHVIAVVLLWLALAGFAGFKVRQVAGQRMMHAALQAMLRQREMEAAALRRECATVTAELAQAEQQLAVLPAVNATLAKLKPEQRDEIDLWLGRVRRLRQVFADHPERRIPEMQFLKDEDWMRAAKTHPMRTEDEIRAAAAAIRSRAVGYFTAQVRAALRKFQTSANGEKLTDIRTLAPYFEGGVDLAMLQRYEVIAQGAASRGNREPMWLVANKDPIDPDYDTRYQLSATGLTASAGLAQWHPEFSARQQAAYAAQRRANASDSINRTADLLPYFKPPLEPDLAERLERSERAMRATTSSPP